MPSTMIHLAIAHSIRREQKITDDGQFYLGAIAPDAVNLNGKATKEVRYGAHLRSVSFTEWIKNVSDYAKNHEDLYKKNVDFFKGFLVHILTDIAWDQASQPLLFEKMSQKGVPADELNIKKWDELDFYDLTAVKTDTWQNEIKPRLKSAIADCSLTVDADTVNLCREYVASEKFLKAGVKAHGLITDDMIESTKHQVLKLFENI